MHHRVTTAKLAPAQLLCLLTAALLIVVGLLHLGKSYGDQLPNRSLTLSHATVNTMDTYRLNFSLPATQTLGSIKLQFCQEGPLPGTPCTAPAGIDASAGNLISQSGETGFSFSPLSDVNNIILARAAAAGTTATNLSYELGNIHNPSNSGTFFARVQTYSSTDASGASTDDGGLALSIVDAVTVSATVPPYLYFCVGIAITNEDCATVTGNYINFGNFNTLTASTAVTQMVAGTNAQNGYAITANGTTLTSGINTIPALAVPDVSRPGTSQFGMNLRANTDPVVGEDPSGSGSASPVPNYNVPDMYQFNPGDVVATSIGADLPRKFTTTYITNISKLQAAGIYVSTLTYIATASF